MIQGVCELLWLKMILNDLKVKYEEPMILYCNINQLLTLFTIQFSMIEPCT